MTPAAAPPCRVKESRSASPIAFASTGEKLDAFEQFHPDRMSERILGMGDVLTLIEKAEEVYEKDQAEEAAAKLLDGQFTLDDFLEQMQQIKKMGSLNKLLGMMPGVPKELKNVQIEDKQLARVEGIIHSMTPAERAEPDVIDASRRTRIARGSGVDANEVTALVKQFIEMRRMMKQMGGFGTKRMKSKRKDKGGGKKPGPSRGGSGRVTPKGPAKVPKMPLSLPGLDDGAGGGPPGLPGLPGFPGLPGLK